MAFFVGLSGVTRGFVYADLVVLEKVLLLEWFFKLLAGSCTGFQRSVL